MKDGSGRKTVPACFSAEGPGNFFRINGRLNSVKYIEILEVEASSHHMRWKLLFQHTHSILHHMIKINNVAFFPKSTEELSIQGLR